jgi:CRP-like cAMP-binding protein
LWGETRIRTHDHGDLSDGGLMIKKRSFKAGEVLLQEKSLGENAFIIDHGRVEVTERVGDRDVHLAYLGSGDTCGEMSMVDDKPRSATVTALEDTKVSEMDHDGLYEALQTDPEVAIGLLRALFERLREANTRIQQLEAASAPSRSTEAKPEALPTVVIEARTAEAKTALPGGSCTIDRFPFRIGRVSHNPLVHNDLELSDSIPWQISRHHVAVIVQDSRVGIVDRGSHLGSKLDSTRIGGEHAPGPVFPEGAESTLVLGTNDSPYEFKLVIKRG